MNLLDIPSLTLGLAIGVLLGIGYLWFMIWALDCEIIGKTKQKKGSPPQQEFILKPNEKNKTLRRK